MHLTTSTSALSATLLDPVRSVIERGLACSALGLGVRQGEVGESDEAALRRPAWAAVVRPELAPRMPAGFIAAPVDPGLRPAVPSVGPRRATNTTSLAPSPAGATGTRTPAACAMQNAVRSERKSPGSEDPVRSARETA